MRNFFAFSLLALFFVACTQTKCSPTKKAPALVAPEQEETVQPKQEETPPPALRPVDISFFDESEAGCSWNRLRFPGAELKTIAQFPSSCVGVDVAWSKDLTRALVSFNPNQLSSRTNNEKNKAPKNAKISPLRAFEVEPATGKTTQLPALEKLRGEFKLFGLTPEGAVALTLEWLSTQEEEAALKEIKKKTKKPFQLSGDGEKISIELPEELIDGEGELTVAHAWQLKDGRWKRAESKFTTVGFGHILDVRALEAYQQLGPTTNNLLEVHSYFPEVEEPKEVEALSAWTPQIDGEHWGKSSTPYGDLFVWERTQEFGYATGLLLYQPKGGALAPLPELGFGQEDLVALLRQDRWLLIGTMDIGAWPRLYDLKSGRLLWSSNSARAAVFWPE